MALQAKVPAAFLQNLAVGIMARCAIKSIGTADLVRAGYLLQLAHVAMAPVTNVRRNGAKILGSPAKRRQILSRLDVSLFLIGILHGGICHTAETGLNNRGTGQLLGLSRFAGRRGPIRDVIVTAMAIDAGHATMGVLRAAPLRTGGALILIVAPQAGLGPRSGSPFLKLKISPGSLPCVSK